LKDTSTVKGVYSVAEKIRGRGGLVLTIRYLSGG